MDKKEIKIENIIDMGLTFSTMARVFEKGSKENIKSRLKNTFDDFTLLTTEKKYRELHETFCDWLVNNIKTSRGEEEFASWGHAGKVIDVVLKVCIYYCHLPSCEDSKKIVPWLNAPIDTNILNNLKKQTENQNISNIESLKEINQDKYNELQKLVRVDIEQNFTENIYPVHWDDMKWRESKK